MLGMVFLQLQMHNQELLTLTEMNYKYVEFLPSMSLLENYEFAELHEFLFASPFQDAHNASIDDATLNQSFLYSNIEKINDIIIDNTYNENGSEE